MLALAVLLAVSQPYRLVPDESRVSVEVGRAGLFKMFGHDQRIEVRRFSGQVDWNGDRPEESSFRLEVEAASLTVADENLGDDDRAKVQADMETQALALSEHPRIVFQSTEVRRERSEASRHRLKILGTLDLRGVSRSIEVPIAVTEVGDRLRITAEVDLESDQWGVPQISALGGSVKTREQLQLVFDFVAAR